MVQFVAKPFHRNEVIDICIPNVDSITLSNPTPDAWTGEIRVTKYENGVKQDLSLSCTYGCTGAKFVRKITVDGNGNSKDQAPSWCFNGNGCSLKIKGNDFGSRKSFYVPIYGISIFLFLFYILIYRALVAFLNVYSQKNWIKFVISIRVPFQVDPISIKIMLQFASA